MFNWICGGRDVSRELSVTLEEVLRQAAPVLPLLPVSSVASALSAAERLFEQGVSVVEVPLRSVEALLAIEKIRQRLPDLVVGAGTVLLPAQMKSSLAVGASFIVSPGWTPALHEAAQQHKVPLLAGAATPSEIIRLQALGYSCLKFFPAEAMGGMAALSQYAAVFPSMRFVPSGGLNAKLADAYLAMPNVLCVAGSWICNPDK